MTVREFLENIRYTDMLIDSKLQQIKNIRERLCSATVSLGEKVQGSKDPDKFTDGVAKIIELEKAINADIDKLVEDKRIAREMIEELGDNVEKVILYRVYFERGKMSRIAHDLGYSKRWVETRCNEAIKKLENSSQFSQYFA